MESKWCWCCVVPPPSAGEVVAPINCDEVKKSLISRGNAIVSLNNGEGFGILVADDLVLTTHATLPDPQAAGNWPMIVHVSPVLVIKQKLLPKRFFVTNKELDLTLVSCERVPGEVSPLMLDPDKISRDPLEVGNKVHILGHPRGTRINPETSTAAPAALGDGQVSLRDDKYLRIQTDGMLWSPGSAGFNDKGQLAFVVSNPQKLGSASSGANGVSIKDVCAVLHKTSGGD